MLIWFMIACSTTSVSTGGRLDACMPMQRMASKSQCEFVADQYRKISANLETRCIAIREPSR